MVYYFTSNVVQPPVTLFMGVDKFENEDLIKWGWPEDVWFHVDKVSSAHVYLRLPTVRHRFLFRMPIGLSVLIGGLFQGQTLDDIPSGVLEDAAQLVKANSITGNKMNDVDVVYTMWANLKKTASMEVGQVGFHKEKDVRKIRVAKRNNDVVNRLNKTKVESHPDFRSERENRDRCEREDKKRAIREQKERDNENERRKREEADLRSYRALMNPENMGSVMGGDGNDSDEFM